MDKDTPRYGSRDEDEGKRSPDDSPFEDDRKERRGFTPSRYSDEEDGVGSTRSPAGSYTRSDDEPTSSYRSRLSSLDGLRASRYDPDEPSTPVRDRYRSAPARDNVSYDSDSAYDTDRPRYRSRLSSTFGDRDKAPRNPLLREDPSERKFSWEQDPPDRPLPDRSADSGRYGSGRSRLDELTSRRAARTPRPGYGLDETDDNAFDAPPAFETGTRAAPLIRPPDREADYQPEPPLRHKDGYYGAAGQPDYETYEAASYQGAHARELADVDDRYATEYQYDADGGELGQNYSDFDQDFPQLDQAYDEQPEKRRRGPFLLLGSLLGVAVIAGGLIFVYQQGLREGQTDTIPVVTVDETPIKVEPTDPGGVNISRKTKLIYDRIIGEETQSNDTLVPREEVPLSPSDQNQSNNASESETETVVAVPSAAPEQTNADLNGSEPLPLPLPPPPSGIQELVEATKVEQPEPVTPLATGGQIVAPTGLEVTNEPPAPASQETLSVAPPAQPLETNLPAQQPDAVAQLITSPPLPKDKPTPPSLRAEPGIAVPSGPIQIAPLPGSVAREVTTTEQNSSEQTAPTPAATPTQQAQRRVTSSRFGEELTSGVTNSFTQQNSQVAAVDTQVQTQTPAPTPVTPQVQEQPLTGGRYLVQLGAFRSEAEAQSEFQNLRGRHPNLLGSYTSLVQQADLGATGVYYRLRIGPIETKSNASQLCNSLIAAGERDCLVRQR